MTTGVEFRSRGKFSGLGRSGRRWAISLRGREWTDATSMALSLDAGLVEWGRLDMRDRMERSCRRAETGYFSRTGRCLILGRTGTCAFRRFRRTGEAFAGSTDPRSFMKRCLDLCRLAKDRPRELELRKEAGDFSQSIAMRVLPQPSS